MSERHLPVIPQPQPDMVVQPMGPYLAVGLILAVAVFLILGVMGVL